jgi:hypothetical protein
METFDFFDNLELPEPLCLEPTLLGEPDVGHDDLLGTDGTDGGRDEGYVSGMPRATRCAATATLAGPFDPGSERAPGRGG